MENLKCDYCGKIKAEVVFAIGASNGPDWCMVQGTGKMTCPDCYTKAMEEGRAAIDRHVEAYQKRSRDLRLEKIIKEVPTPEYKKVA